MALGIKKKQEEKPSVEKKPSKVKPSRPLFHLSLRFKLAVPVLILVTLMLFLLFQTTYRTVRSLAVESTEGRLKATAEVFAETVKVPLILKNQQVLLANIEWMAKREDVVEVRVEDSEGVIVGGDQPTYVTLPDSVVESSFLGVRRVTQDTYAVAVPIQAHERQLGRVLILFSKLDFEGDLREIFKERLQFAFLLALFLSFLIAMVTWIAIQPIFILKRTTREILAGDLSARARILSFDEIQDLGNAFNEMVARLEKSLDSLRSRTEALEESEEKYRLIVESASDIIFSFTPEKDLILLNKGFSGCTRKELLKEGFPLLLSLHTEDSHEKFLEAIEIVMQTKQPVINVALTHIHRSSKKENFYLTNFTPVIDHNGNIKTIQGVMRDITELRRIEMMKESLIRDVAHELKTPTAKFEMAVNWFEKEIHKHKEMEKYQQVIEILKSNTDRLMRTIVSIMDLSKLESGMQGIEKEALNLNDVLEQVRQDMEPLCREKRLTLETALDPAPLAMRGDRDMLYRLFVNLIGNSLKFTELGTIKLASKLEGEKICVSVTDTGVGIEAENIERIFDRFVQKTASSLGIGVGLTISKDIAVLHHGRIWAESAGLGKGATFKVEFPTVQ